MRWIAMVLLGCSGCAQVELRIGEEIPVGREERVKIEWTIKGKLPWKRSTANASLHIERVGAGDR